MSKSFCVALAGLMILGCAILVDAQTVTRHARNSVVEYLQGAELQAETNDQVREIQRALSDMLNESAADSCARRRYADYQLTPNMWTITRLLGAYFLPATPQELELERFCKDVIKPKAKAIIREKLNEVNRSIMLSEP